MLTKAQWIWSLFGAVTGTTAFQAYEHRQELMQAAKDELPIAIADSLAELAPPNPTLEDHEWNSDTNQGFAAKVSSYLDSARGSLQSSNAEVCEGYCKVKRDKCVRVANHESDLVAICQDEHQICTKGCHADESPVADSHHQPSE